MLKSRVQRAISFFFVIFATLLLTTTIYAAKKSNYPEEIQGLIDDFVDEMVQKHKFKADYLDNLFSKVKINTTIMKRMDTPYEEKPWYKYREYFVTETRTKGGVEYWEKHKKILSKAEKEYGVPAHIIVAVIGIETKYGAAKGTYGVFEALTTLAFKYPRRNKFFKKELEEFLLLTREHNFDPLAMKGSRAGAIGLPQFIPSSYRHYAVKYAGKSFSDLINNDDDAIGSVANYLNKSGWAKNQPVAIAAKVRGEDYKMFLKGKKLKPTNTVQELRKHGIKPRKHIASNKNATLIEFDTKDGHEYWIGLQNFYVISRYNNHKHYVQAVYQLSEKIRKKHIAVSKA